VVVPAPLIEEEIPLARRSQLPQPRRPSFLGRLLRLLIVSGLVTGTVLLLMAGPLRRWLTPPTPVAGLNARLSADGRLLGHFPYPEASPAQLVAISSSLRLQRDAAAALLAMQRAAAADGVNLVVLSAFRPLSLQRQLFFDVKAERNQSARDRARVSAPPGFSEHSTGFAVDLGDGRLPSTNLSTRFDGTPSYRWLAAHAQRFHFQLSFPAGNAQGVSYEPWHWRFEGSTEALRLFEPAQRLAR
jgi:D-alanyl-D-alanine carboxypeptidase